MKHWLMKTEPGAYSWEDMLKDGNTYWDGVRNYQARNNLRDMQVGDLAFFYHSVKEKRIMGIVKIVRAAYQDPTVDDDRWVAVDIEPVETFENPITLADVKADDRLSEMVLVNNTRLSVQPVRAEEFDIIIGKSREN